jgi:hypothetical protein
LSLATYRLGTLLFRAILIVLGAIQAIVGTGWCDGRDSRI